MMISFSIFHSENASEVHTITFLLFKEIKIKVVTTYKSFNTLAANYVVVIIIRMTFSLTYFFSSQ